MRPFVKSQRPLIDNSTRWGRAAPETHAFKEANLNFLQVILMHAALLTCASLAQLCAHYQDSFLPPQRFEGGRWCHFPGCHLQLVTIDANLTVILVAPNHGIWNHTPPVNLAVLEFPCSDHSHIGEGSPCCVVPCSLSFQKSKNVMAGMQVDCLPC